MLFTAFSENSNSAEHTNKKCTGKTKRHPDAAFH